MMNLHSTRSIFSLLLVGSFVSGLVVSVAGCNSDDADQIADEARDGVAVTEAVAGRELGRREIPSVVPDVAPPVAEADAAPADQPAAQKPAATKKLGPTKALAVDESPTASRKTLDITFDDLKFPHKPDDPYDSALLTKKVLSYVGKSIRVRGYILPTFQENGIKNFVLVRDNQECCFGPGAALYDCVRVQMDGDNLVTFSPYPISVEGEFKIEEARDYKDVTRAVFFMHGKVVK